LELKQKDIYLQMKFTTPAGQDFNNSPYHPDDNIAVKVDKSITASLTLLDVS